MSRVGGAAIKVNKDVKVAIEGNLVKISGKLGEFSHEVYSDLEPVFHEGVLEIRPRRLNKKSKALWGLSVRLLSSFVEGVQNGYTRTLEMTGVGFRAACDGKILNITSGFSHQVLFVVPQGVTIKCPKPTTIEISGSSKQQVGQVAAVIRDIRKPEPYKGKGIRYTDEQIRRKEDKKK